MNNHLSDGQLNEILDGLLASPHLESCAECQRRLADLRAVTAALDSLSEIEPPFSLAASVVARLRARKSSPALRWVLALQAVSALAIFAWLGTLFKVPAEVTAYQLPSLDSLVAQVTLFMASLQLSPPSFSLPLSGIELSTLNLTLLLSSAAALWIVGNNLLLRAPARRSSR